MKQIIIKWKKRLNFSSQENRAYQLLLDDAKVNIYCHMTDDLDSCGGGGWTMVMKMDGSKVSCFSSLLNLSQMFYLKGKIQLVTCWENELSSICAKYHILMYIKIIGNWPPAVRSFKTDVKPTVWKTFFPLQSSLQRVIWPRFILKHWLRKLIVKLQIHEWIETNFILNQLTVLNL